MPTQTQQQVANSLNPTPVTYNIPTSGLWRRVGDNVGDSLYKTNSDGNLTQYNLSTLGLSTGATGQGIYSAGQNLLKNQYGLDFWSLPEYNMGDIIQQGQRNISGFKTSQGDFSELAQPASPTQSKSVTVNNTPNKLGDIAGATAAQTQQLAGDQGMNVTKTTTPEGVAVVQKTPLALPSQTGANPNAIPMGNGTPGGYVAAPGTPPGAPGATQQAGIDPATGKPFTPQQMSMLDALKMDLLGAQNALTKAGAAPNELSDKYNAMYTSLKGTQTPTSGGAAMDAMGATDQKTNNTTVTQDFMQGYGAMNYAEKQQYDTIKTALSTPATQQSLEQKFAEAMSDPNLKAGIPGESLTQEQMKMLDLKKIMDGNEDAIRAEITKAGGFATEQQVQAMTTARNKVLLQQASYLQDSMALKQDYIDHLMNFTEKDRAAVEKEVDRKLGLEQMQIDLQDKMTNAAQSNYQNIIKTNGFQGLYTALSGNPTAIAAAEKTLGLPSGSLQKEAALEAQATADKNQANLQFVSGTANQRAGVFNPTTGAFTPTGGGSGGTGGGTGGGSTSNPLLSQVIGTIKGSLSSPTKQQLATIDAIANSSNPLAAVRNQAQNIMGQTAATKLYSQETAQASLDTLGEALKQYYKNGGDTNYFSGNLEFAINKLGEVKDPKQVAFATQIETALQAYRNAISGTAYSNQEGQAIAYIFPGINKTEGLNTAILTGRQQAMKSLVNASYDQILGPGVYEQLQQTYGSLAAASTTPDIPKGSILITRNGQSGYINSMMEFDPKTDKMI